MFESFPVVALISGRGSNLKSLISHAKDYQIVAVFSDNPDAPGLDLARQAGILARALPRTAYQNRKEQRLAIFEQVYAQNPALVCLAGFMQIVDGPVVDRLFGRLINIHPALLPAYPGLHTHARALAAKEKIHGCTVHYVDSGVDTGPIIAQASNLVEPGDSEESLAARVLANEHRLYPWVVQHLARGEISLHERVVRFSDAARISAQQEGFILPP